MKFDWYQASIPDVDPQLVIATLARSEYYGEWEQTKALKGYDEGAQFVVGNEVVFRLNHGGQNSEYGANVLASGGNAPKLASVIREHFPKHRVARLDSCEDYHHKDAYRFLRKAALRIAKDQKVQVREIVKPLVESDDGRTLYLGSKTSAVQMRIYEKGKQLGCGTEWVRAELMIRPQKQAKEIVSLLSPDECWGLSKWSLAMGRELGNSELQKVDAVVFQQSDHERAYRFMLRQYRKALEAKLADCGSWETVGAQIGYDLAHPDELPDIVSLKLL